MHVRTSLHIALIVFMAYFALACKERPESDKSADNHPRVITEAGPGEKWVYQKGSDFGKPVPGNKYSMLIPEDWEVQVQEEGLFWINAPQETGGSDKGWLNVISGPELRGEEGFFSQIADGIDGKWGKIVQRKSLKHPVGSGIRFELKLKEGSPLHFETYCLYSDEFKWSWWITGKNFESAEEGSRILERAFWSMKLQ